MVRMRVRTFFSLLVAPFIARCALAELHLPPIAASPSVLQRPSEVHAPSALDFLEATQAGSNGRVAFYLPSADDDEYFHFSIEANRDPESSACGDLQIRVNGEPLERSWIADSLGHASSFPRRLIVAAEGYVSQVNHSFGLQVSSFCYSQNHVSISANTTEVVTFQILTVDGRLGALSHNAFVSTFQTSRTSLDSTLTLPSSSRPVSSSPTGSQAQNPDASIDDEVARLERLELEYTGVQRLYQGQKQLVNDLGRAQLDLAQDEISQCPTMGCVFKTLYQKTKGCFHLIYLRYGLHPNHEDVLADLAEEPNAMSQSSQHMPSSSAIVKSTLTTVALDSPDCVHASSPLERAHLLMSNQQICSNEPYLRDSSSFPTSDTLIHHRSSRSRAIHTTLDVVACILCLSCLFALLQNRLLNPRTAAERDARREERRARKAYQRAARKQAFKMWWTRHFGTKDEGRIQDYEEKRAMILSQEMVLEQTMQAEIDRHRHDADDGLSAAEEGRSDSSSVRRGRRVETASLPPTYRSRASSGRPPSYTSYEDGSRTTRVVDGFRGYRPGRMSTESTDRKSHEDSRTPDSSVYSLSPRPSSETLRTQFSAV